MTLPQKQMGEVSSWYCACFYLVAVKSAFYVIRLHLLVVTSEPVHRASLSCNSDACLVNTTCMTGSAYARPWNAWYWNARHRNARPWNAMHSSVWVTSSMMDQKAADACLTFHTAHMSLNHNVRKVSWFCDGAMTMTITMRIVFFKMLAGLYSIDPSVKPGPIDGTLSQHWDSIQEWYLNDFQNSSRSQHRTPGLMPAS